MQVDSQNPLSEESQPAKNAKKAGQAGEFDGTLMASLMSGVQAQPIAPNGKPLAGGSASQLTDLPQATQVDLSGKQQIAQTTPQAMSAKAAETRGIQIPDTAGTLLTKANQSAAGTMTGALVAGPNQPWSPEWVFGNDISKAAAAKNGSSGAEQSLDALRALVKQAGGDGTQSQPKLAQANADAMTQLQSALDQMGAEVQGGIQGLSLVDGGEMQAKPAGQPMPGLGGAEYLNTLQGVRADAQGQGQGGMSGDGNPNAESGVGAALMNQKAKNAQSGKGGFQLIEGGLSSGNRLGNRAQLKEESRLGASDATLGAPIHSLMQGPQKLAQPANPVITGHVVPGAMMKERLTSESLTNVTTSIRDMRDVGGGEMKIRMNPGNLGELMIRVTTEGNHVGLKVQASDHGAKKILEESISSLKDSLASQNLSLGRVDISVAQPTQSASSDLNSQNWNSQSGQNMAGFDARDGGSGSERSYAQESSGSDRSSGRNNSALASAAFSRQSRGAAAAAAGRLDVMA